MSDVNKNVENKVNNRILRRFDCKLCIEFEQKQAQIIRRQNISLNKRFSKLEYVMKCKK